MDSYYIAGADPELMLVSPAGDLISAIPLVPGTKEAPFAVECGALQHDNVMAEFNVSPSGTSEELEHNMREVLRELVKLVAPNRIVVQASAEYPEAALENEGAKVFGCDPDFDSWTLQMNEIDGTKALANFRSAGGHFHIGHKPATKEMLEDPYGKIEVVKMLDVFQGIVSVVLDDDPTAPARRGLYGRAGSHRPKDYGVEYRALGNFWVRSPDLVHLMYELANYAVHLTLEGRSQEIVKRIGEERIQQIINTSDTKKARKVVGDVLSQYLPEHLIQRVLTRSPIEAIKGRTLEAVWGI